MPLLHLNYIAHCRLHFRCSFIFALRKKICFLLCLAWLNSKKLGFTLFLLYSHKDWTAALVCSAEYSPGLPTCLQQKKSDSSFKAYTHKICITKHKIDIKTHQEHRYTIPLFRSIFFRVIMLLYVCFLSIKLIIFKVTVKYFSHFVHSAQL